MSGEREVGVGPWQGDWPKEPHYDPALLEAGDRRNVPDRYRYWRREAIIADLDAHYRNGLHVAIENIDHDFNIGSIVRTANAFGVAAFHIVGKKRWNRRGAMVTDRYQHEFHHARPEDFLQWARDNDRAVVAVDIVPGAVPLEHTRLPKNAVLVFGEEGGGVSKPRRRDRHAHVGESARRDSARTHAVAAGATRTVRDVSDLGSRVKGQRRKPLNTRSMVRSTP